jgi:DNA polymerase
MENIDKETIDILINQLFEVYKSYNKITQSIKYGYFLYDLELESISFNETGKRENIENTLENLKENIAGLRIKDNRTSIKIDSGALNKKESYLNLVSSIRECRKCDLSLKRINVVVGTGPIETSVMIIGEAPGEQEDIQGLPFVGRAGQLLTKIMESSGLDREKFYITNCVKCRPPNNRVPAQNEIISCFEFLKQQIQLIRPSLIISLGATSTSFLLQKKVLMNQIHGKIIESTALLKQKLLIYPVFHPSFLLRDNTKIPEAQKDFVNIAAYIKKNNLI